MLLDSLCVFSIFFLVVSGAPRTVDEEISNLLTATDMSGVCDTLTKFFNTLNEAVPLTFKFSPGITEVGISYPAGNVEFGSAAVRVKDCSAYLSDRAGAVVHLDIQNSLSLEFPEFKLNGEKKWMKITMDACHAKLHYQIKSKSENDYNLLHMNSVFAEIHDLGKVIMATNNGSGVVYKDFTEEADDVIRPIVFKLLDNFTKQYFQFDVSPDDINSNGVLEAFELVFKSSMVKVHKTLKDLYPDPTNEPVTKQ